MDTSKPHGFWSTVLDELRLQMAPAAFDTWLRDTQCTKLIQDDESLHLTVAVRNSYGVSWLRNRLQPIIVRNLARMSGMPEAQISIEYVEKETVFLDAADDEAGVEISLVHYNPEDAGGFTITSNYATQFWQPYIGYGPFAFYQTLRSFAWRVEHAGAQWPSLRHLAEICANGRKQTLTGRKSNHDDGWITGWLQILEGDNLVYVDAKDNRYRFAVVDRLPFLTPAQVARLSPYLQRKHELYLRAWDANLRKHGCDLDEWFDLEAETLVSAPGGR